MSASRRGTRANRRLHERQILDHLGANRPITQRSLSSELGIALGLTNLLIRHMVKKGWVRVKRVSPRRLRYLLTPAGIAAQTELTREHFLNCLSFYRETRERVREQLALLSRDLELREGGRDVVFYGTGDIAEVTYLCLREAGFELVGVIDSASTKPFLDFPVHRPSELMRNSLGGRSFSCLIVMPLQDEERVRSMLLALQVPSPCVFWL